MLGDLAEAACMRSTFSLPSISSYQFSNDLQLNCQPFWLHMTAITTNDSWERWHWRRNVQQWGWCRGSLILETFQDWEWRHDQQTTWVWCEPGAVQRQAAECRNGWSLSNGPLNWNVFLALEFVALGIWSIQIENGSVWSCKLFHTSESILV
jgi:hypothetical protein